MLTKLPAELTKTLAETAISLNTERMDELIEQVRTINPATADGLQALSDPTSF